MLRYRLRTLLVLMAVGCCVLAYYHKLSRELAAERQARSAILDLKLKYGGIVELDDSTVLDCAAGIRGTIHTTWLGPQWLKRPLVALGSPLFKRIDRVSLTSEELDDKVIPHLMTFSSLKHLSLFSAGISRSGFRRLLVALPTTLENLELGGRCMDDELLQHFGRFTNLKRLLLVDPSATPAGLQSLSSLRSLHSFSLSAHRIDDEALSLIESLDLLEELDLTGISSSGIIKLCRSLPAGLKRLSLTSDAVDERALKCLDQLKSLQFLQLSGRGFSGAMTERFRVTLTNTKVHIIDPFGAWIDEVAKNEKAAQSQPRQP